MSLTITTRTPMIITITIAIFLTVSIPMNVAMLITRTFTTSMTMINYDIYD